MDKRKEANIRVKNSITKALLSLMYKKSFSEISITEIIRDAKVARASFYRNYTSKEDVLLTLVRDALINFRETADYDLSDCYRYTHIKRCFSYFKVYCNYVLDLCNFGCGEWILKEINNFHEDIAGIMPCNSIEKYKLYVFVGALYNTAVMWLKDGSRESVEDITAVFCRELGIPIEEN